MGSSCVAPRIAGTAPESTRTKYGCKKNIPFVVDVIRAARAAAPKAAAPSNPDLAGSSFEQRA